MKREYKLGIFVVIVFIIVLISGILFYESPKSIDNIRTPRNTTKSFIVDWNVRENLLFEDSDSVRKNSNYEKTISLRTPNLKEITFRLSWEDNKAPLGGRVGLDTLTLEITTPDGKNLMESAKSTKKSKLGNIEITIPIKNNRPSTISLESEHINEVRKQLLEKYYDYKWVNEDFLIKISVKIGEIRPLKRLLDRGNDFDLEILYSYYDPSITED